MTSSSASFARVPASAVHAELSATDFKVLLAISLHADRDGRAFPSMARVAEIIGIRRGDIPRSLKRLEECGLMRRQRVPRPKGGWQVNHYELVYEPLGDVRKSADTDVRSTTDTKGVRKSADRCPQPCGQGVRKSAALTKPINKPMNNSLTRRKGEVEGERVNGGRAGLENNHGQSKVAPLAPALPPSAAHTYARATVTDPADVVLDPSTPCRRLVATTHGCRNCNKPSILGMDRCPEHAPRNGASAPLVGNGTGAVA